MFKLHSDYKPTGDQPSAIKKLTEGVLSNKKHQVLLGVTGSGKTFTVANVIKNINRPTLVISHNKTLAAQLYQEFRDYFPENAVEYFVSYYDYYQPESYIPQTDTYIEKDSAINEQIDKLRLSATTSLMTRKDVIVVASVSCIYNIGSPVEYTKMAIELRSGMKIRPVDLLKRFSQINYDRSDYEFKRGTYRVKGDIIDVFPAYQDYAIRLEIFNDFLTSISYFNPLTGENTIRADSSDSRKESSRVVNENFVEIFPAKHYVTPQDRVVSGMKQIQTDLQIRLKELRDTGKNIEAYRLEQRTNYDLEMIQEIGYCKGIENYSLYFDGRKTGDLPYTLLDFFPKDFLIIIDESHISVPQIRGMYNGDRARKETLINYGFRLPSALDNRPLNFEEFMRKINQNIYTSATPADWELSMSEGNVVEQLIRPTGLLDPKIQIIPSKNQIQDLLARIMERISSHQRVLVTTLTKRMAEELSAYLLDKGIKVTYLHSDINTLERTDILDDLRRGNYDVLVGINLLREGLDLPEVSLVAILDADKEGFLRSDTSLIQTMGRAARHLLGEVVMYADTITGSMQRAIDEVDRRRDIQAKYNKENDITPQQITKPIRNKLIDEEIEETSDQRNAKHKQPSELDYVQMPPDEREKEIKKMEENMRYAAEILNFEEAARLRDIIRKLKNIETN